MSEADRERLMQCRERWLEASAGQFNETPAQLLSRVRRDEPKRLREWLQSPERVLTKGDYTLGIERVCRSTFTGDYAIYQVFEKDTDIVERPVSPARCSAMMILKLRPLSGSPPAHAQRKPRPARHGRDGRAAPELS
jgi:hypothetical protein